MYQQAMLLSNHQVPSDHNILVKIQHAACKCSTANFQALNTTIPEEESKNLDMLLDIPLQVTVELGRTKRSVKEILDFLLVQLLN